MELSVKITGNKKSPENKILIDKRKCFLLYFITVS